MLVLIEHTRRTKFTLEAKGSMTPAGHLSRPTGWKNEVGKGKQENKKAENKKKKKEINPIYSKTNITFLGGGGEAIFNEIWSC